MQTKFILLGRDAITHFYAKRWQELEDCILKPRGGELVGWNIKKDKFSTLLDMLDGWGSFIQLRKKDLKAIEKNTKIEIQWKIK